MGAGWVDGDLQSEKRRNREWILGRLRVPAYDINDVGAVTVDTKAIDGLDVQFNVYQRHYLVASHVTVAMLHSMTFLNRASTNQHLEVLIGTSDGLASTVVYEGAFGPGDVLTLTGPWFLNPTNTIWTRSLSGGDLIGARFEVTDFIGPTPGIRLVVLNGFVLPTLTGLYLCPTSGVRHTTIAAITICNTNLTSTALVGVAIVPNAEAFGIGRQYVFNSNVYPGETVILDGFVLEPGDSIAAGSSVLAGVTCRVSPIEFTL